MSLARLSIALAFGLVCAQPLAAQELSRSSTARGLSPNYVWLSASAALLSGSLGGVYALRVNALYEQSRTLPAVSPTQVTLKHQAQHAEVAADALFATALAFGVASVWLALIADWTDRPVERARRELEFVPVVSPRSAGVGLVGTL